MLLEERTVRFSEEEYDLVENVLLNGKKFNSQQRSFIELFESKIISASPGAGKTTSLAAKIILLLKYLTKNNSKEGVCVITHTNVAVNEISTVIQKAGIKHVGHPHFIGTIHEFFNRFCLIPFFKKEYKHNELFFNENLDGDREFYKLYIGNKYPWIKKTSFSTFYKKIVERICKNPLFYNEEFQEIDMENLDDWDKFTKYRKDMINAKIYRKRKGILEYNDTFLFSNLLLQDSRFKKIINKRFKYVFIDEFQDTSVEGVELLNKVFDGSNNILQMIGDPYQTIMYGQPMPTFSENQLFRLDLSNRFGEEISKPLNQIMPEAKVQVIEGKESIKPIILLYQDEKTIYPTYKRIIDEYERENSLFRECDMHDKILIRNTKWANRLKESVTYLKKRSSKSINVLLKEKIINFIYAKTIDDQLQQKKLKNWINTHREVQKINSVLIDTLKNGLNIHKKNQIKGIVNCLLIEKGQTSIDINNNLFLELEYILHQNEDDFEDAVQNELNIFTIHSVKGETLRSALIVNFDDGPLVNILLHRYAILKEDNYVYTDRNLLYVALSRVAHLFIFAIQKENMSAEAKEKLENHWSIIEVN